MAKIGQIKPFRIEEKKEGPLNKVSEVSFTKWRGCMLANIKKEEKWHPFLTSEWSAKKTTNRGLDGAEAAANSLLIDAMLEYVSQYAPNCLYRDITLRSKSLEAVWTLVRDWAGLKTVGSYHQTYYQVRRSYDPNGDVSAVDFFFELRNAKEDCLLRCAASGGSVRFRGAIPAADEELSATMESDVVGDWIEAIGGPSLLEHVFRVFSKDLETETLADVRQRIADNLVSLKVEAQQQEENNRVQINRFTASGRGGYSSSSPSHRGGPWPRGRGAMRPPQRPLTTSRATYRYPNIPRSAQQQQRAPCKLCLVSNPQAAATHSIANCRSLDAKDRQQIIRAAVIDPYSDPGVEEEDGEQMIQGEHGNYDGEDPEQVQQQELYETFYPDVMNKNTSSYPEPFSSLPPSVEKPLPPLHTIKAPLYSSCRSTH